MVEIVTLDNLAQKAVAESEKHRMRKLAVTDNGQGTIRKPSGSSYDREPDRGRALRNAI